ncbi:hypothetical protein [Flavivirga sp. 57AJ16]|uniref:hypothetical protein n=1 Tax=Flavivirga sp. 57AJ16 TaxID=3025307 RepID=UPI002366DA3D|nr:hypothetical protein [Flavivirga sp. 57AJ16]MDD7885387.1 hypothetical protein [Flavivirga sp. 57AJ16]
MIKKLTLLLTMTLLLCFSCQNGKITLEGEYEIIGCKNQPEYTPESIIFLGATDFGEVPFEFTGNTLKLSSEMRKHFGNTEFEYKLTDRKLILFNQNKKIEMTYVGSANVLRLFIDGKYLKRMDLVRKMN